MGQPPKKGLTMRIALLTDGIYPYVVGGMQKHSYNLAKYFAQQKIYIDLYHCNSSQTNYNIQKLEVFSEEEKNTYTPSSLIFLPNAIIQDII